MKTNLNKSTSETGMSRRVVLGTVAVVILGAVLYWALRPAKKSAGATEYYQVKRGDFTISVVEGGTLTAVSEVIVRNEVEGTARIISIVPEGSYVRKGDLLVELDSAQAQDQANQQKINFEKAKFAVQQAEAQLEIQRSATNSDYLAALLKVKFAKIDRDKYRKGQKTVDLIEASNKLVQAHATLMVNVDTYHNSTNLAAKGYETKQKVDADHLTVLNNQNAVLVATNSLWMLQEFDVQKQTEKFDSDVLQAEQELERVVNQNTRKMAQYEADLEAQKNTLALSQQKLERDERNLAATRIVAVQDGLVVYQVSENRFSSESLIEGGATVRNRQELIKLPDLSRMKVTIKVHESHVNMVRPGLPAFIMLDSMPEKRFRGTVEKVAPLPDSQSRFGNPNLKVYNTDVYLEDAIPNVKPGISARAEIIVTNVADALSVPIQAVTTFKGKQVVYLVKGVRSEPQPVEVGMYNTKFIEITSGVKEGEKVLLSPPFDSQEKDIDGSVLAADEKASFAKTNKPSPRASANTNRQPSFAQPGSAGVRPGPGAAEGVQGGQRKGGFDPQEMLKRFDKNGDGQLDDEERTAMQAAMPPRGQGGGGGFNREEMMKRFDKNGDGELDEEERAAMRAAMPPRGQGQGAGQSEGQGRRDRGGDRDAGGGADRGSQKNGNRE